MLRLSTIEAHRTFQTKPFDICVLSLTVLYAVIASLPDGRQGVERRSNLISEIATLPLVARKDKRV